MVAPVRHTPIPSKKGILQLAKFVEFIIVFRHIRVWMYKEHLFRMRNCSKLRSSLNWTHMPARHEFSVRANSLTRARLACGVASTLSKIAFVPSNHMGAYQKLLVRLECRSMNRYEILGRIGEGAFGTVSKAKRKETGQQVGTKIENRPN